MKKNNGKALKPFISPLFEDVVTGSQELNLSKIRMNVQYV